MTSPKEPSAQRLPNGPADREALARIVDEDGARDEAENGYFEDANDPQFVAIETAQRRFRSQLRRRLRHRDARRRPEEHPEA
ncbi:hypothetical protein [Nocardioides astragali]|uniref:Uncharacterized protein n=1 Tax=Nocardioides astragali TaxID=1776736 RepID=A0ABW2N7A7_9ACTN|nr:hypothetical protein [Nocardioides astragali]